MNEIATVDTKMSTTEADRLAELEVTIAQGLTTFVEVGAALAEINKSRLYRVDYGTFEDYCRERWQIARRTAYQLIDAAQIVDDVRHGAHDTPAPASERQARALSAVPPEQRAEVWREAVETAPKDEAGAPKITAAHVSEVVQRHEVEVNRRLPRRPALDHRIRELVSAAHAIRPVPGEKFEALSTNDMMIDGMHEAIRQLDRVIAEHELGTTSTRKKSRKKIRKLDVFERVRAGLGGTALGLEGVMQEEIVVEMPPEWKAEMLHDLDEQIATLRRWRRFIEAAG